MYKTGLLSGDDYTDVLIRYSAILRPSPELAKDYFITRINDSWSILSVKSDELSALDYENFGYAAIPEVYSLQDYDAMEASGITRLRNRPGFNLRGRGVLIGIIDTGINYLHEAFINEDNTSRIVYLWNQENDTVYDNSDINEALAVKAEGGNPFSVVDERDQIGHGTMLAGISGGNEFIDKEFSGAAPECEFAVVKLRGAKENLREFYLAKDKDVPLYSETDILLALKELNDYAEQMKKPISFIFGMGESLGSHDGAGVLPQVMDMVGGTIGRSVCVAAGNMANMRQHFFYSSGLTEEATVFPVPEYTDVEINVESNKGFFVSLWSQPPFMYNVGIISPQGFFSERISRRQGNLAAGSQKSVVSFPLSFSRVEVFYGLNEAVSGQNYVILRFLNPEEGVWTIRVYTDRTGRGGSAVDGRAFSPDEFHMWISDYEGKVRFLAPNPFTTVTGPGNSFSVITAGAYNNQNGALFPPSGRGNTLSGRIEPDFLAPGAMVLVPSNVINDSYYEASGTSIAAAVAGGAATLLLEYGIVNGNRPYMSVYTIKNFFIENATKTSARNYPNPIEGWGYLNL